MCEILFRGKREDNGQWIFGTVVFPSNVAKEVYCAIVPLIDGESVYSGIRRVIPETVGQFTGLTDKNGKNIFEGDICRVCLDPEICMAHIQYDERTASFNMRYDKYTCNTFLDMRLAENRVGDRVWIEVIGNIHDNPELLEEGA